MVGAAGGNPCTRPPASSGDMPIITQLQPAHLAYGPFISRQQAQQQGLRHYYTGIPCRNGHVAVRGVAKWNCLQCDRKAKAAERLRDPERVRANERRTAAKHRSQKAELASRWRKRNPDRVRHYAVEHRRRYRTDPVFKVERQTAYNRHAQRQRDLKTDRAISVKLRNRIHCALAIVDAKKAASSIELIGCTVAELRQHLEAQFVDGMNWDNYGRDGWHVDHIRPCASFDLADPDQQRQCFHYSNLQPLWAADNIRKGARWQNARVICYPKHAQQFNTQC
jgi:hypothetical protein